MFSSRSVQIAALFSDVFGKAFPNLCRSFYNETKAEMFFSVFAVALLAEGVDRNFFIDAKNVKALLSPSSRRAWIEIMSIIFLKKPLLSPSSRRAWIEIGRSFLSTPVCVVALLAEGVDRNRRAAQSVSRGQRSPSSRRAWIEMAWNSKILSKTYSRPPRGGRG